VVPIVLEVVGVAQAAALDEVQLVEGDLPWIWQARVPVIGVRILVPRRPDFELILVIALPRHRDVKQTVHGMQCVRAGNREPPPDRGLDLGQLDVEQIQLARD